MHCKEYKDNLSKKMRHVVFIEQPLSGHRARIFSPFVCMEKTCGLMKTCASLKSPPVSFSFLYVILPLCLSHLIINWDVFNKFFICI